MFAPHTSFDHPLDTLHSVESDVTQIQKILDDVRKNPNSDGSVHISCQSWEVIERLLRKHVLHTTNAISTNFVESLSEDAPRANHIIPPVPTISNVNNVPLNQENSKKLQHHMISSKPLKVYPSATSLKTHHGLKTTTADKILPLGVESQERNHISVLTVGKNVKTVPRNPSRTKHLLNRFTSNVSRVKPKFEFISVSENQRVNFLTTNIPMNTLLNMNVAASNITPIQLLNPKHNPTTFTDTEPDIKRILIKSQHLGNDGCNRIRIKCLPLDKINEDLTDVDTSPPMGTASDPRVLINSGGCKASDHSVSVKKIEGIPDTAIINQSAKSTATHSVTNSNVIVTTNHNLTQSVLRPSQINTSLTVECPSGKVMHCDNRASTLKSRRDKKPRKRSNSPPPLAPISKTPKMKDDTVAEFNGIKTHPHLDSFQIYDCEKRTSELLSTNILPLDTDTSNSETGVMSHADVSSSNSNSAVSEENLKYDPESIQITACSEFHTDTVLEESVLDKESLVQPNDRYLDSLVLTYDGHVVNSLTFEILKNAKRLRPILERLPTSETTMDSFDFRFEAAIESLINDMKNANAVNKPKTKPMSKTKAMRSIISKFIAMDKKSPAKEFKLPDSLMSLRKNACDTQEQSNQKIDKAQEVNTNNDSKLKMENEDNMFNIFITHDHMVEANVNSIATNYNDERSSTSSSFDKENTHEGLPLSEDIESMAICKFPGDIPPVLSPENMQVISDDEADDYCPPLSPHVAPSITQNNEPASNAVSSTSPFRQAPLKLLPEILPASLNQSPPKAIMGLSSSGCRIPLTISKVESLHIEDDILKNVDATPTISKIICHVVPLSGDERHLCRKSPTVLRKWAEFTQDHLFKCPEFSCSFMSIDEQSFSTHIATNHNFGNSLIACIYCSYKMRAQFYITHLMIRHAKCNYKSAVCFYRAARVEYVKMHYALAHGNNTYKIMKVLPPIAQKTYRLPQLPPISSILKPHICSCNESFYCPFNYAVHREKCLSECSLSRNFIYHEYGCRYCPFGASTNVDIIVHTSIEHPHYDASIIIRRRADNVVTDTEPSNILDKLIINNENLCVKIDISEALFEVKHNAKNGVCAHMPINGQFIFIKLPKIPEAVLAARLYRCGKCMEYSSSENTFREHILKNHSTHMSCGHCGIRAKHVEDIVRHVKLHGMKVHVRVHKSKGNYTAGIFMVRCSQVMWRVSKVAAKITTTTSPVKSLPPSEEMETDVDRSNNCNKST